MFDESFRLLGRGYIENVPQLGRLPYAVLVVIVVGLAAWWIMNRTDFGLRLMAVGGNPRAAALAGVPVQRERIIAFTLSALAAVVAGILAGGFAGVTSQAGEGFELEAIAAVVFGGVLIGGGQGRVAEAITGALSLRLAFTLLNILGLSVALEDVVEGVIIIAALTYAGFRYRRGGSA
ncbi:MAG: ABC transporter permease [Egibacteraceae bacterium]